MGDSLSIPVPYDDLPHRRTFFRMLALLIALQAASAAARWASHRGELEAAGYVERAREVDAGLGDLMSGLKDAETGQRGYLLTADPTYLEPYARAVAALPAARERVRAAAAADPVEAGLIARLDPLVSDKLAELAETVRLGGAGQRDAAVDRLKSGFGKELMDQARELVDDLKRREADELRRRQAELRWWTGAVDVGIAANAALNVVILAALFVLWRRAERTRASHAEYLLAANAGLRAAVTDRDRLVSVVAHDLRGLFTPILGYADLLRTEAEAAGKPALAGYARHVVAATTRANDLLANLVNWARESVGATPLRPAVVPVRGAVDQVIQLYADVAAEKRVELVNDVDPNVAAFVDPPILQAVLRNLVSNAVKYSNTGGRVEVGGKGDGRTVLTVRDFGVGMSADVKAGVLGNGRVAPTPGTKGEKGTGLGLAICADYLARSGGGIEVDTEPGSGTTFTVILPVQTV